MQLSTFKSWNFDAIGFEKKVIDGATFVCTVWCNVCRRQEKNVMRDNRIRGAARTSLRKYIDSTNFVTKHNVSRREQFESSLVLNH